MCHQRNRAQLVINPAAAATAPFGVLGRAVSTSLRVPGSGRRHVPPRTWSGRRHVPPVYTTRVANLLDPERSPDLRSAHTGEEVVRRMHDLRTREVAVR